MSPPLLQPPAAWAGLSSTSGRMGWRAILIASSEPATCRRCRGDWLAAPCAIPKPLQCSSGAVLLQLPRRRCRPSSQLPRSRCCHSGMLEADAMRQHIETLQLLPAPITVGARAARAIPHTMLDHREGPVGLQYHCLNVLQGSAACPAESRQDLILNHPLARRIASRNH